MNRGRAHESGGERKDKQGVTILWHVLQSAPPANYNQTPPLFSQCSSRGDPGTCRDDGERRTEREQERERGRETERESLTKHISPLLLAHLYKVCLYVEIMNRVWGYYEASCTVVSLSNWVFITCTHLVRGSILRNVCFKLSHGSIFNHLAIWETGSVLEHIPCHDPVLTLYTELHIKRNGRGNL